MRRHARCKGARLWRKSHMDAALVMLHAPSGDQAQLLHPRQDADEARTGNAAQLTDVPGLKRRHVQQCPHHAPLLLGNPVRLEQWPKMRNDPLARPQHEHGQIAVVQLSGFGRHVPGYPFSAVGPVRYLHTSRLIANM